MIGTSRRLMSDHGQCMNNNRSLTIQVSIYLPDKSSPATFRCQQIITSRRRSHGLESPRRTAWKLGQKSQGLAVARFNALKKPSNSRVLIPFVEKKFKVGEILPIRLPTTCIPLLVNLRRTVHHIVSHSLLVTPK